MIVELSAEAEADIEAIGDYIARDNPMRALSFTRELRDKCLELGALPSGFPLVDRYAAQGVRRRVHGGYLIFYRVMNADRLVVLHVLHGARDYGDLISPT